MRIFGKPPEIKYLLVLISEAPPEGEMYVLRQVLDHAYYKGHLYRECVSKKTKMKVLVTGPEDFSNAFIIMALKTQFPEIDLKNLEIRTQRFAEASGRSYGVIVSAE